MRKNFKKHYFFIQIQSPNFEISCIFVNFKYGYSLFLSAKIKLISLLTKFEISDTHAMDKLFLFPLSQTFIVEQDLVFCNDANS